MFRSEWCLDAPYGRWRGGWLWACAGALAVLALGGAAASAAGGPQGVLIRFEGSITPLLEHYLYRKLDEAHRRGADRVIIEIDSPGGYLTSSLETAERLRRLQWAETIAFVPREALSGAAIVALGCDKIYMHPEARLGDAGPIFQGKDALFHYAPEKIRSDLARRMSVLAQSKHRPPALAEAMVDPNLTVFRVKDRKSGRETFMSEDELRSADEPDRWEKIKPVVESGDGRFLEVTGERAVELHLADGLARDRDELAERCGVKGNLLVIEPSGVDAAVYILNLPLVTGLLLVTGLIALYIEFSAPGISVGGLLSGLCFALFFWSRFLGGTAGVLEIVLFLAGVVFLLVELFVLPGFGVAGVSGLLLIVASLVLASQNFVIPHTARELATLRSTVLVVLGAGAIFLVAAAALTRHFGAIPLLNRLALQPPSADEQGEAGGEPEAPGPGPYAARLNLRAGDRGKAESPLRPAGKAIFANQYIDVIADGSFIEPGRPVRIVDISGNRIVVREIDQA